MAFVILHPQQESKWKGKHGTSAEDLKAHVKVSFPGFAVPEWINAVPDLPASENY